MPDPMRVRFAPSPTGYLHVGGARTALFNWLMARGAGGVFVLRIEDTDRERSSDAMTAAILEGLGWLGLDWDEGPFHQADGLDRHRLAVGRLLESGAAYRCFCTPAQLEERRAAATGGDAFRYDRTCLAADAGESAKRSRDGEVFAVRFQIPEGATEWDDLVHDRMHYAHEDIEDFVIQRSDGTPTYNLAVVADDIEMRITHVVRGDDHLANTPKQILLYQALGEPLPQFGHLPMILGPDAKRLSKRHGATAVGEYEEQGLLPEALVNFLALLGWNPGDDQEIMSTEELIARFSVERINKKSAVFDPEKLAWMNSQHLSGKDAPELFPLVLSRWIGAGLLSEAEAADRRDWLHRLIDLLKPRTRVLDDFVWQARPYLAPRVEYDPAATAKHWANAEATASGLDEIQSALAALDEWSGEAVEEVLRELAAKRGVGFGKVVHPLRLALSGGSVSPGIDQVLVVMGPAMVSQRIAAAIEWLGTPAGERVDMPPSPA